MDTADLNGIQTLFLYLWVAVGVACGLKARGFIMWSKMNEWKLLFVIWKHSRALENVNLHHKCSVEY